MPNVIMFVSAGPLAGFYVDVCVDISINLSDFLLGVSTLGKSDIFGEEQLFLNVPASSSYYSLQDKTKVRAICAKTLKANCEQYP